MTNLIDVFNGDADGLCALLQWRLTYPAEARRISGVKRDNALLQHAVAQTGDDVLVLDINFANNRHDVQRLLAAGAHVRYFDHHFPGELIEHPHLSLTINQAPDVCTSLLVNQALAGQQVAWAITGAFGDNLPLVATALAEAQGFSAQDISALRQLGELLNYNGYGTCLADLHFDPLDLYVLLYNYRTPLAFVATAPEFKQLAAAYADDMALAAALQPIAHSATAVVYQLPDFAWARRVIGVWANQCSQAAPQQAHLLICPDGAGAYTASVRSAQQKAQDAAAFCRRFPRGGGRAMAGGITALAAQDLPLVITQFLESF